MDLPLGVYEISVQGYVRYLDGQRSIDAKGNTPEDIPIYVYMNESKTNFPNWFDYPQEPGFFAEVQGATYLSDDSGYEYPDNTTAAAAAFAKGDYTCSAYGLVANQGDILRVGVKGNPSAAEFWPCFDNFRLTYRGYTADVVKPILEESLAAAQEKAVGMTTKTAKAQMDEAIAAAQAAISSNDGKAMFDALSMLTIAVNAVEEGAVLCHQLNNAAEELIAIASESSSSKVSEALNLATDVISKLEASALDEEEIADYLEQITKMKIELQLPDDYMNATDENPADVTAFIQTPGFSKIVDGEETNSIEGWTATGYKFGNSDQLSAFALESWESELDIYQDIVGLPNGTYVLKVNAWQRTSTPTYLYAISEEQYYSKELITQEAGLPEGYNAPSSLIEAAGMFDEYTFVNELVLKVTDETLRIGIVKEGKNSADWIVMDNFQLIYHGTESALEPEYGPLSVSDIVSQTVQKVEYFTIDGRKANAQTKGLVIRKATLADGTIVVKKIRK